ncbi:cell wall hydrolase [Bauldia sp.]|uniref:cell wall hydrolase n=1 Tax=Bauldia sp. TaxID=2575872 RepID=UPI003BAB2C49
MGPTRSAGVPRPTIFLIFLAVCLVAAASTTRWAFSERRVVDVSAVDVRQSHAVVRTVKADLESLAIRPTFDRLWPATEVATEVEPVAADAGPAAVSMPVLAYASVGDALDTHPMFDAVFADPSGAEHVLRRGFKWGDVAVDPVAFSAASPGEARCLAHAVYFEARGEDRIGQTAVAQVVINRVRSRRYPDTICKVVYQNEHKRHRCQFSFACDGKAERVRDRRAWDKAMAVAQEVLAGSDLQHSPLGSATHYHAVSVSPFWASKLRKVDRIGQHIFYSYVGRRG